MRHLVFSVQEAVRLLAGRPEILVTRRPDVPTKRFARRKLRSVEDRGACSRAVHIERIRVLNMRQKKFAAPVGLPFVDDGPGPLSTAWFELQP